MQKHVLQVINEHQLLIPGQRLLVAVSGGVDSMVLLELLRGHATQQRWKITVAHVNHQLRGASSLADERSVRSAAERMKLPIVVLRADVRRFAKQHGMSVEMAARKIRHDFLARAARRREIQRIALAHHQDDQVEHFFLRLFRGSGGQGLRGMKFRSPSPSDPEIMLVRPLLNCSKEMLRDYALQAGVTFREDSSNDYLDIQRNRIRHELLPLLKSHYQPALVRNVLRVMSIIGAESDLACAEAETWLRAQSKTEIGTRHKMAGLGPGKGPTASGFKEVDQSFEDLPIALQRRIIQLQLLSKGVRPEFELVEHLRQHPQKPMEIRSEATGATVPIGAVPVKAAVVRLHRNGAWIEKALEVEDFHSGQRKVRLRKPGTLKWDGVRMSWRIEALKGAKRPKIVSRSEIFDADRVGKEVTIRHWQPGDRFQPIGMKRAVKLQDLFVNQKLNRGLRRRLAIAVASNGEIFWVEGMRISERFKLTEQTIRRLHWVWQRL